MGGDTQTKDDEGEDDDDGEDEDDGGDDDVEEEEEEEEEEEGYSFIELLSAITICLGHRCCGFRREGALLLNIKEEYPKGIISLFPYLADPRIKLGYEHYQSAEDGSGYLSWRIHSLQKEASGGRMKHPRQPQTGGPTADRDPYKEESWLNDECQCQEAIALMKHTADEAVVKEKMRLTLAYHQKMLHDPKSHRIFYLLFLLRS
ncbi:uncharacterized protein [Pseudorasbora parva]|uniref:uncharacterized protein n=1 Tax=Pseudorasbora parva TaxID=51549 RepID=UPI00351E4C49